MEQSNSRTSAKACLLKDCKALYYSEKSTDPGQCLLSRSRSWRLMARKRSNSISISILPSIPEYPGFQDTKRNYSKGSNVGFVLQDLGRARLENPPNARSIGQNRNFGYSADHFTKGHCKTKSSFCDKTLQDYFNERLFELQNYGTKKPNGKTKGYPNENQNSTFTSRRLRRRSSCSEVIQANHLKLVEEYCNSTDQASESLVAITDQDDTQNVEEYCKRDYLESLTMSINGPLEMFLQRK